jgi:hypothetical protein
MNLMADADGTYLNADPTGMEMACRYMAAWKLASKFTIGLDELVSEYHMHSQIVLQIYY